jgi:multiple sugar transport system ATP-binding protein
MARIRFAGLAKRFGAQEVLAPLELEIADGEFFTFVGPSGCGKSTLLNLIAGVEPPSAGALYFDEMRVDTLVPGARDVAMVFQSYALYPHLSVRENIAFPLRVRRTPRAEIEREVARVAEVLGLGDLLERKPRQLSGGQRQRVALGRALVRRPRVFLMDEPLSNLDARLRLEMREELKRLHEAHGVTTVYVTHDQEEAMALSQRVAVLSAGRIEQCGARSRSTPIRQPVRRPVIGSPPINVLEGERLHRFLPSPSCGRRRRGT